MRNTSTILVPDNRLPAWMQQSHTRVDWGVLLIFAFSLMVAWSFIMQPGLPRTNGSESYVFLADDYATAFREGRLYPRWSAHALEGYGAPIPHFYPPAAPYAAGLIQVLITNDSVNAVRILYVVSLSLAGCATYALILRQRNARNAILGSLLYVTSPYLGLVAPHLIGDLADVMGMALLPTLLWSIHRVLYNYGPLDILMVISTSALLMLTDPSLWAVSTVLALIPLTHYAQTTSQQRGRIVRVVLSLGLSPGLVAFYWIPALLDQSTVTWMEQTVVPGQRSLTPAALLTPVQRIDLSELSPMPQLTLGLPLILSGIAALFVALRARHRLSLEALYLGGGLSMMLLALLVYPNEIWLMGPITFCLAVGGSSIGDLLPSRGNSKHLALPLTTGFILVLTIPVLLAPRWPAEFGSVTPNAQIEYNQRGWGTAVLPPGAAVPVTIHPPMTSQQYLTTEYRSGTVNRITPDQITADRQISFLASHTHSDRFQIDITDETTITVLRGYFPGWAAFIAGEPLRVRPEPDRGLLQIALPAQSSGELTITMGTTEARQRAWLVTMITSAIAVIITLRRLRRNIRNRLPQRDLIRVNDARLLSILLIACALMIGFFMTPNAPFSLHARPGYGLDNTFAIEHFTETGLQIISYDLERDTFRQGETIEVRLAWRATRLIESNFQVYIHLRDTAQNVRWQQADSQHPGGYPTSRWSINAYVRDDHTLVIPNSIPPGTYEIAVEVGICEPECLEMRRLTFYDPETDTSNQVLPLPTTITITR